MACYHPIKAFQSNVQFTKKGKGKVTIISKEKYDSLSSQFPDGDIYQGGNFVGKLVELPCDKCIGCRLEYSRQWAIRCVLEASQYKDNYFVTLTYSPDAIKSLERTYERIDFETGEFLGAGISYPLNPDDMQTFMKDLRSHYDYHFNHQGIRFYGCGEYGDKNGRPHFHIILFNLPIYDLVPVESRRGVQYYESATLSEIWKKGIVKIGRVTFDSCAYVARYMTKKLKGDYKDKYICNGLTPEFCRMSRMPGLARSYYDKNTDRIYMFDEIILTDRNNQPMKVKPAKYFDRLFDEENTEIMSDIKKRRQRIAKVNNDNKLAKTNLDKDAFLVVQEENKNFINIKFLKRFL